MTGRYDRGRIEDPRNGSIPGPTFSHTAAAAPGNLGRQLRAAEPGAGRPGRDGPAPSQPRPDAQPGGSGSHARRAGPGCFPSGAIRPLDVPGAGGRHGQFLRDRAAGGRPVGAPHRPDGPAHGGGPGAGAAGRRTRGHPVRPAPGHRRGCRRPPGGAGGSGGSILRPGLRTHHPVRGETVVAANPGLRLAGPGRACRPSRCPSGPWPS